MRLTLESLPNFRTALTGLSQLRIWMKEKKDEILKAEDKISKEQFEDFEENILPSLNQGVFSFYNKEVKLKDSSKRCFDSLANIRENALCMRCSGKASQFWDSAKQKYLVKRSTCFDIIDSCIDYFAYFSEVMTFMRRLGQFREALHGNDIRTTYAKGML